MSLKSGPDFPGRRFKFERFVSRKLRIKGNYNDVVWTSHVLRENVILVQTLAWGSLGNVIILIELPETSPGAFFAQFS